MSRTYKVALLHEDEGGYAVVVPALPGCVTQGRTLAQALERAKEAIACHLESLQAHGELVPEGIVTGCSDEVGGKVLRVAV